MKTAIAVFVKTPSLSPVKTRLSKDIGKTMAEKFYTLSLNAIKKTISNIEDVQPYFAVAEKNGLSNKMWLPFPTFLAKGDCLGEVLHNAYKYLNKKHENIIFIGSDSPQISPDLINKSINLLQNNDHVFGKANDGGFYLFASKKNIRKQQWLNVEYSTEKTLAQLAKNLTTSGNIAYMEKLIDVDNKDDLKTLVKQMPDSRTNEQQDIINWIRGI